jgi:hypothetical protein
MLKAEAFDTLAGIESGEIPPEDSLGAVAKASPYETMIDDELDPSKGKQKAAASQARNQFKKDLNYFTRDIRRLQRDPRTAQSFLNKMDEMRENNPQQFYGMFPNELFKDKTIQEIAASKGDVKYKKALTELARAQAAAMEFENLINERKEDADPAVKIAAAKAEAQLEFAKGAMNSPNFDTFPMDMKEWVMKVTVDYASALGLSDATIEMMETNWLQKHIMQRGDVTSKLVYPGMGGGESSTGYQPSAEAQALVQ